MSAAQHPDTTPAEGWRYRRPWARSDEPLMTDIDGYAARFPRQSAVVELEPRTVEGA